MLEGLFQPTHLIIIFAIALLVFGPKKLPELGKGLGEGIRALKEGMKDNPTPPAPTEQTRPPNPRKPRADRVPFAVTIFFDSAAALSPFLMFRSN